MQLEDEAWLSLFLCCSTTALTGHCCSGCWCCWLPSDCIHGTGSHRHGDGPRERDPVREGEQRYQYICSVLWWWGWIVILSRMMTMIMVVWLRHICVVGWGDVGDDAEGAVCLDKLYRKQSTPQNLTNNSLSERTLELFERQRAWH